MKYIELSRKDIEEQCKDWAKEIQKSYQPDLIVYVAKAGYLIGREMKDVFNVPLVGISATREGNALKEVVGPIVSRMPNFVRNILISLELKSDTHSKNAERQIHFHEGLEKMKSSNIQSILVVDDSVDTGHSMKQVVDAIHSLFGDVEIKIAGLNVWDKSRSIIDSDFALYKNTVIKSPMSKDSKEYKDFMRIYNSETNNGTL